MDLERMVRTTVITLLVAATPYISGCKTTQNGSPGFTYTLQTKYGSFPVVVPPTQPRPKVDSASQPEQNTQKQLYRK